MELPSQQEIDAVKLFVFIASELEGCRFFIEEHRQLSISYHVNDVRTGEPIGPIRAHFPDPDTVSAVLIPFRKLWMQGEPCFYRKIANIIKRYCANLRWRVDLSLALNDQDKPLHPLLCNVELSKDDVIDLWLNVRYMHSGKSNRSGRFSRSDFEHWKKQIGATLFEFYFLSSVWNTGICSSISVVMLKNLSNGAVHLDCSRLLNHPSKIIHILKGTPQDLSRQTTHSREK